MFWFMKEFPTHTDRYDYKISSINAYNISKILWTNFVAIHLRSSVPEFIVRHPVNANNFGLRSEIYSKQITK